MKVAVVGAGVIGLSSAWMLLQQGFEVELVDQAVEPAAGCSHANGGQLSYHYNSPINQPGLLRQLPLAILGKDPTLAITYEAGFDFFRWGLKLLACSIRAQTQKSSLAMQQLGIRSGELMTSLQHQLGLSFDYRPASGKLYLYFDQKSWHQACHNAVGQQLSKKQLQNVPGIHGQAADAVGALIQPGDESGDAALFCQQLFTRLQQHQGFQSRLASPVTAIRIASGRVLELSTPTGSVHADHYLIACGCSSVQLARKVGIKLPIYPMKGYSLTVPATGKCPDISITDTKRKIVYCRLGNRLRIAGFAEFSGWGSSVHPAAINNMLSAARQLLPEAGNYKQILQQWCGLRPVTPDSLPLIGQTKIANLWLNTGHGMLGWTHALSSAELICQLITSSIGTEDTPFNVQRF
ncbi:FAD-dependent oxidoreductase [Spartinivicinus poritis]|uniref:FAD-dependent oxidoreductase n=1 Tax=Spartinivicinus poritis TaxID=2994640 RepID=A0ABT5UC54_9GAMM|nr:FAD-dependent oxidoreductase [Spartinivicinus sp. A2-2]MDE1463770.1 FAD-dependent oxidoreductase [Spartinivicinus sp. A2-2]